MCYDARMRQLGLVILAVVCVAVPLYAADPLSDARRLYNQGQFDAAEQAARDAARTPALVDGARVVLGRIQLERYRRTPAAADLSGAIATFRTVDTSRLDTRERIELVIGLAEALYLEDRFGAASAMFESYSMTQTRLVRRRTSECSTGGPRRSIVRHNSGRRPSAPISTAECPIA